MSLIRVFVAWSDAGRQHELPLQLPVSATLQQALDHATASRPALANCIVNAAAVGVWGKVRGAEHLLRDGDRVEIYRTLKADPKEARRSNAANRRSVKM
jgi:uncharacterized protein